MTQKRIIVRNVPSFLMRVKTLGTKTYYRQKRRSLPRLSLDQRLQDAEVLAELPCRVVPRVGPIPRSSSNLVCCSVPRLSGVTQSLRMCTLFSRPHFKLLLLFCFVFVFVVVVFLFLFVAVFRGFFVLILLFLFLLL